MNYRWSIAPIQDLQVKRLSEEFDLSPLLAQCLLNRGHDDFENVDQFLRPKLKNLSDPFTLPNIERAVERLLAARESGEKVVVFGDYDVDGVTSTALIIEVLSSSLCCPRQCFKQLLVPLARLSKSLCRVGISWPFCSASRCHVHP